MVAVVTIRLCEPKMKEEQVQQWGAEGSKPHYEVKVGTQNLCSQISGPSYCLCKEELVNH